MASRRHAEDLIRAGTVSVNGQPVTQVGVQVDPQCDEVRVAGRLVRPPATWTYLALNKPAGFLTSVGDPRRRPSVIDLLPSVPGLFPVGRLDADSEGLLLLTNDGEWAQRIMHPRHGAEKEYVVDVVGRPTATELAAAQKPMELDGKPTTGARLRLLRRTLRGVQVSVVLHEGRKREIRRMFAQLGYRVQRLVRVRVGSLRLGELAPGAWRHLSRDEVQSLAP